MSQTNSDPDMDAGRWPSEPPPTMSTTPDDVGSYQNINLASGNTSRIPVDYNYNFINSDISLLGFDAEFQRQNDAQENFNVLQLTAPEDAIEGLTPTPFHFPVFGEGVDVGFQGTDETGNGDIFSEFLTYNSVDQEFTTGLEPNAPARYIQESSVYLSLESPPPPSISTIYSTIATDMSATLPVTPTNPTLQPLLQPPLQPLPPQPPLQPQTYSPQKEENPTKRKKDGTLPMREIRKMTKPEKCKGCGKGFQYRRDLEEHMSAKHRDLFGKKPAVVCRDCKTEISKSGNMSRHLKSCKKRRKQSG